jgi:hypothetical protein
MCFLDEQEPGVVSDRSSPAGQRVHRPRSRDKKNKPCTNRLMVVAGMALVKASGRDGGGAAMRTQASGGGG